jgi:hypothetical protein
VSEPHTIVETPTDGAVVRINGIRYEFRAPWDGDDYKFSVNKGRWEPKCGWTELNSDPVLCVCGSKTWEVFHPEAYCTAGKCSNCGNMVSLHTG